MLKAALVPQTQISNVARSKGEGGEIEQVADRLISDAENDSNFGK